MTDQLDWREIGAQLRRARVAANYSQEQLGRQLGLDRTMIAKCEAGTRKLDALELTRISTTLGLPLAYFLTPPPAVLSRRRELVEENPTSAARDSFRLEAELSTWLHDVRQLMDLGLLAPRAPVRYPRRVEDHECARKAADWIREELGIGDEPLETLVEVAERLGQLTLVTDIPGAGASIVDDDVAVAIVSTQSEPARRRATAAHELGHMVLGDEYSSDLGVHSSRDERERLIEAFTAEFLMPVKAISPSSRPESAEETRRTLIGYAARYRVSWTLMLGQALRAGLINEQLRTNLTLRTPTRAEIMDAVGWTPQPDFAAIRVPPSVARAVSQAVEQNAITPTRAVELTRGQLSPGDFEAGSAGE
jgi:Zn-dependent peptidase ImmA (M78 family)/DNA-binding XRE family transcriptional regulator